MPSHVTKQVIVSGSLGADYHSPTIPGHQLLNGSIQLIWTGSPVGNFNVQGSNQVTNQVDGTDVTDWTTLSGSTEAAGGIADSFIYNFVPVCWQWIRIIYTYTSGTGTLQGTYYLTSP